MSLAPHPASAAGSTPSGALASQAPAGTPATSAAGSAAGPASPAAASTAPASAGSASPAAASTAPAATGGAQGGTAGAAPASAGPAPVAPLAPAATPIAPAAAPPLSAVTAPPAPPVTAPPLSAVTAPAPASPLTALAPASAVAPPPITPTAAAAGPAPVAVAAAGAPAAAAGAGPVVASPAAGAPPAAGAVTHTAAQGGSAASGPPAGGSTAAGPSSAGPADRGAPNVSPIQPLSVPPITGLESVGLVPVGPPPPLLGLTTTTVDSVDVEDSVDVDRVRRVVEAAGGASQVRWAAGIVAIGDRQRLGVTSDRGRGWMPAEAVLPADVFLPWRHPQSRRWEGLRDPARVILEFAAASGGRVVALASTGGPPAVAAGIPWAIADTTEHAHPELVGGPVVTRFEVGVPAGLRGQAATVPPQELRERAFWAAYDAALKLGLTVPLLATIEPNVHRIGDLRWLNSLNWGGVVAEHTDLCGQERAERLDVRDIPAGRVDTGGAGRRYLARAYAAESLLAVRTASPEQALRDALYAREMALAIPPARATSPIAPLMV